MTELLNWIWIRQGHRHACQKKAKRRRTKAKHARKDRWSWWVIVDSRGSRTTGSISGITQGSTSGLPSVDLGRLIGGGFVLRWLTLALSQSHWFSFTMWASSIIYFPSLYFWLDSKACSYKRNNEEIYPIIGSTICHTLTYFQPSVVRQHSQ